MHENRFVFKCGTRWKCVTVNNKTVNRSNFQLGWFLLFWKFIAHDKPGSKDCILQPYRDFRVTSANCEVHDNALSKLRKNSFFFSVWDFRASRVDIFDSNFVCLLFTLEGRTKGRSRCKNINGTHNDRPISKPRLEENRKLIGVHQIGYSEWKL